jgi:hypothetical protein
MVARGFTGEMPTFEKPTIAGSQWVAVIVVVLTFVTVAALAFFST